MRERHDQTGTEAHRCSRTQATPTIPRASVVAQPHPNAIVYVRGRFPRLGLWRSQGHPGGCSKISRGPALHQPGPNVAPTGTLT